MGIVLEATKTEAKPVSKKIVEAAQELAEVRGAIRELEARKKSLTETLELEFGKTADNTADYSELIHRGLSVAKLNWVTRAGIDKEKLAEQYPEAFADCSTTNTYSVVKL